MYAVLSHFSQVQLFCNPMDCSPLGSLVHEILQARILEWVAMPSSRGFSQLRDWTHEPMSFATPVLKVDFYQWATREAQWWYRTIWWYGDSQWCYLTISSSVTSFSPCPQSFPVSGSFPISQLFTSGGQSIGRFGFNISPSNAYSGLIS